MSLWLDTWCFDIPGVLTQPRPHNPHIPHHKTTQLFWWNIFPLMHALSAYPSAPLCQTCAGLLKCWTVNVHKHFKHWRAISLKPSYICWGYCFRQQGKVQISIFFFGQVICSWKGFRSLKILMITALQSVFTPRTNSSGKHLRTSVKTDLCEYLPLYTLL